MVVILNMKPLHKVLIKTMNQILNKQYRHLLALSLVLLIIVQNLLPIQTHTKAVVTDSGRTIIVCTLEGLQTVSLDEFGQVDDSVQHHQTLTAATQFSELMSTATSAVNSFQITSFFVPSVKDISFATTSFKLLSKSFQLIRAPPPF